MRRAVVVASMLLLGALAPAALGATASRQAVPRTLQRLYDRGALYESDFDGYMRIWSDSAKSLKRLKGRRHVELGSVIGTLNAVAAHGQLTSTRLPLAFLTLDRNRVWWTTGSLLGYGARVSFKGSQLIWESYPGQGIQVQWLGTFGKANAYYSSGGHGTELRALLREAWGLAARRAGGAAFESWFAFDGGRPPWVSGLSTGTALTAFSRAAKKFRDPTLVGQADALLGVFRTPPPQGIASAQAAGTHYLQYSFAPSLRIVNGFVQSLNGLHDLWTFGADAGAGALFSAGEAELRAELPADNTGAWSLYALGGAESSLSYHLLLRDFLKGLCTRMQADTSAVTGGVSATPVADPALYCDTAGAFTTYTETAPTLAFVHGPDARARRVARVRFTLSKVSTVTVRAARGSRFIIQRVVTLSRGKHSVGLGTIKTAGPVQVQVTAVDLAGNRTVGTGTVRVRPARRG